LRESGRTYAVELGHVTTSPNGPLEGELDGVPDRSVTSTAFAQ
jgi:hypothetical protein